MTGIGLVLPGALLPILLSRWALTDQQAGLLLFLLLGGAMSGALLARWSLPASVARGCAAVAVAAVLLAGASREVAFAAMALYGLGLGIIMTAVSLLVSRMYPEERAARITRLNLVWAIGACMGPWIALHGTATWGPQRVLWTLAFLFGLAGVCVLGTVPHSDAPAANVSSWWRQLRSVSPALLFMVPLATGIESSAGGWLATYSRRSGATLNATIGAATCFWAGLLLSRLIQSHRKVAVRSVWGVFAFAPWLIGAGLTLLIASSEGVPLRIAALLIGFGIGPMYPAVLALVLRRGEGGNAVFVAAGVGASLLPLLTGLVSGGTGSLRLGLGVPLAAAIAMAACGWSVSRVNRFG